MFMGGGCPSRVDWIDLILEFYSTSAGQTPIFMGCWRAALGSMYPRIGCDGQEVDRERGPC
jgi:hypothetical protein